MKINQTAGLPLNLHARKRTQRNIEIEPRGYTPAEIGIHEGNKKLIHNSRAASATKKEKITEPKSKSQIEASIDLMKIIVIIRLFRNCTSQYSTSLSEYKSPGTLAPIIWASVFCLRIIKDESRG